MFDLTGRIACVTGASSGIGRALATAFVEAGARVVAVARREDRLRDWAAETGGAYVAADLSTPEAATAAATAISAAAGAPDILVNAAGMNPRQHADDLTAEAWRETIDLNLAVPFFLAQALVGPMKARGWGRVINIASLQSERAFRNGVAYGASKGGVAQLTRAMAEAWSADGVNCNALAPGFFETELSAAVFADAEWSARNAAQTCIGRNGELADLIGPAIFFASPASDYVTGQVLYVDGGFTAK